MDCEFRLSSAYPRNADFSSFEKLIQSLSAMHPHGCHQPQMLPLVLPHPTRPMILQKSVFILPVLQVLRAQHITIHMHLQGDLLESLHHCQHRLHRVKKAQVVSIGQKSYLYSPSPLCRDTIQGFTFLRNRPSCNVSGRMSG